MFPKIFPFPYFLFGFRLTVPILHLPRVGDQTPENIRRSPTVNGMLRFLQVAQESTTHHPIRRKPLIYQVYTLPKTNIAPENRPSEKETTIPTIHFQVLLTVSFREGSPCLRMPPCVAIESLPPKPLTFEPFEKIIPNETSIAVSGSLNRW